jgi:hypothetical protein
MWFSMAAALAQQGPAAPEGRAAAPAVEVTPGVHVHVRPEVRVNPTFDATAENSAVSMTQAARGSLAARKGVFSALVQLQSVYVWGARPGSTSTAPEVFAHQGYIEVGDSEMWVRVGRQQVHMLNGYYLSAAPWNVAGRSFDALRGHWQNSEVELDAIGIVETPPMPASDTLDNPTLGNTLGALFATFHPSDDIEPTVWLMGRGGGPTADAPDRSALWIGPGGRFFATPGDTTIDLNGMGILGSDSGVPIRAYSIIARIDQQIGAFGAALIFDQSSGHACESEPVDGCVTDVNRNFDLGYGRNHYLRGNADQVAGVNARDIGVELNSSPRDDLKPILQAHLFQLTNPEGAWIRNGGTLQGVGWIRGNDDPNLGVEVDAMIAYDPMKGMQIDGGYCFFQPIGAGAAIAGTDPMHYLFVRNRFTF